MVAMTDSPGLAHDLHVLVAHLDRAADRLLREAHGLTYPRFLALTLIDGLPEPVLQRDLAERLVVSEAAASRTVSSLEADGLVAVRSGPGRARHLALSDKGAQVRAEASETLETSFAGLGADSGIDLGGLQTAIRALVAGLEQTPS